MNTQANAAPESPINAQAITSTSVTATRPMYWSVRRELWECRAIYIAPLAAAGVVLFGFLVGTIRLSGKMRTALMLAPAKQHAALVWPYDSAAFVILVTAIIVGVLYCLDALYGERRDRSILFWKSLPVSDLTTVLSKAIIPLVVLPLVIFPIIVTTWVVMLLLHIEVLQGGGLSAAPLLVQFNFFQSSLACLYCLIVVSLWYAPVYAWLLLISAWARRTPILWAWLPPFAISILEKIAFGTSHFSRMVGHRLTGWFAQAFVPQAQKGVSMDPLQALDPGKFLSTPGLWIGLAFAAVFLAAAVRLRRYREPI
jgi:ABC-2 type transport system permease protein